MPQPDAQETAQQAEADRRRERDAKVIMELMATPQGRDWVDRFIEFCCVDGERYANDGDIYAAVKRDGLSMAGKYLQDSILDYCPDRYMQMIRERRGRIAQQKKQMAAAEGAQHAKPTGVTTLDLMADTQAEGYRAMEEQAKRAEAEKPKE